MPNSWWKTQTYSKVPGLSKLSAQVNAPPPKADQTRIEVLGRIVDGRWLGRSERLRVKEQRRRAGGLESDVEQVRYRWSRHKRNAMEEGGAPDHRVTRPDRKVLRGKVEDLGPELLDFISRPGTYVPDAGVVWTQLAPDLLCLGFCGLETRQHVGHLDLRLRVDVLLRGQARGIRRFHDHQGNRGA